jgi:Peptidase family M1 domain
LKQSNEQRGTRGAASISRLGLTLAAARLCLVASLLVALPCAPQAHASARAQKSDPSKQQKSEQPEQTRYRITLDLDFDAHSYTGTERVRWVNREGSAASALYFHLYPNLRADDERAGATPDPDSPAPDEPRLEVTRVRAAPAGDALSFTLEDEGVTMRVQLRAPVPAGASTEVEISFRGGVPEIDPDDTSLPAHVVQQVGAALHDTREVRRARDTNFVSRGVMLLGAFYPVLAAREGGDWRRRVEATVGDYFFSDVADYDVTVNTPTDVALFASCDERSVLESSRRSLRAFAGESLRGFALVAGRSLRAAEQAVGDLRVRSVFAAEHEKVGRRVLGFAADAARTYAARFGRLPLKTVTVTEAPFVAGVGSEEFAGMATIASAFYVDFDSPAMRALPELVREQRSSVEDSLEFASAQGVAQQWWGEAVGSDPQREPVLDEALAQWSALLYVQDVRGEERARQMQEDQLRGVYQVYRTFGGEDRSASAPARDYRNSFQFAAIVVSKGALMLVALRQLLGDARFFRALRSYYEANRLEVAELEDLRAAFVAESELLQRRMVTRTFTRWLSERHGDEDIAPPNPQLAAAVGINTEQPQQAAKDRNAFSRLGRFFWRQMTRIR